MADGTGNDAGDRDGAKGASGAERLTAPADESRRPRLPFPVVGIGASAGGLEAYTEFLQACPADAGMAYVLIQHLPPDRESLLAEILGRHTRMPVLEAGDGQAVDPDRVYVIRPGHTLTIRDGRLRLGPVLAARGHGRPVDDFFRSLAEEQQQRAIAVIFSGMGTNGSAGAQAVKAVGGLVIAQEPDSARYPAMPRGLIDAHLPDYILRPAEVPEALARYAAQPYATGDEGGDPNLRDDQALADVLAVLRTRTRHDFAGYRKPTLLRRVRRRMGLGQFESAADFVRALRQTPAEVTALADDLLIHVTGFFRDPEAWEVLREKVIDPLVATRPEGAEVRCWVSACATGEEAYSLAMLLVEAAEARAKRFDIKVFATDMAERALGAARAGAFPNGIESEVTPERLSRFFDKDDSFYRVRKELRELVIFAPQNMLQDPPFSRLDIATCRNLLIYLEPETQRRVLALLHFGLREGGTLMLGTSESAALAEGDFEPIDKRHRIFRRIGPTRAGTVDLPTLMVPARDAHPAPSHIAARPSAPVAAAQLVGLALLDRHTPAAVAVDAAGQIVHVHGDTSRFLALPAGSPSLDLVSMTIDQVRGAVRTALHRAADTQGPVAVRDGLIETAAGRRRVEVGASPLGHRDQPSLYLVTFRDYPEPPPVEPSDVGSSTANQLADDLQRARDELRGVLEEMQSSNEELKASHEEATSLNEELQSTNEELETSKEEMQSLNEELVTVNAQLQAKMTELEATANDLGSLLKSTDIAVLFLDQEFRIRRFTPAVRDLLDLIPSDVGRPFVDLRLKFADPDLLADARRVLEKLVPIERLVESESGRHYLRRVLPYRTQDHRIDGVVVAFLDVTERRKADDALRESEEKYRSLFNSIDEGFCIVEILREAGRPADFTFLEANPAFERHAGATGVVGRRARELWPGLEGYWFETYGRVAETGEPVRFQQATAALGRYLEGYAFRVGDPERRRVAILFTDVSDRKRAEEQQAFLMGLMDTLRKLSDPEAIQAESCRQLGEQVGAGRAYFVEVDEAEGLAVVRRDFARGDSPSLAGRHRLADFGSVIPPLRRGEAVVVPDVATSALISAAERAAAAAVGIAAHVSIPLVEGDTLVGMLCLAESAPRSWSEAEVGLAREAAERMWAAAERARAERALRESEGRFRAVADLVPDLLWEGRTDGSTDWYNRRWLEYTGQSIDQALGWGWTEAIHPDDRDASVGQYALGIEAGEPVRQEYRIRRADGEYRWFLAHAIPVRSPSGVARWYGAATDIHEERQAAEALRDARDRLEQRVAERTSELEAEMTHRRELSRRILTAQEDERRRVARELHDAIGQLQTAFALGVHAVRGAGLHTEPVRARLDDLQGIADDLGRATHDLAIRLRPTALDDLGLHAALHNYLEDWAGRSGVAASYQAFNAETERFPAEVETVLYRIVQEAIANVGRHAVAGQVTVIVERQDGHAVAIIEDDGRGFDPESDVSGRLGILGMRERAALLGGTLQIESSPGAGTAVIARIPLQRSPQEPRHDG